jgi:hypothetical protein
MYTFLYLSFSDFAAWYSSVLSEETERQGKLRIQIVSVSVNLTVSGSLISIVFGGFCFDAK